MNCDDPTLAPMPTNRDEALALIDCIRQRVRHARTPKDWADVEVDVNALDRGVMEIGSRADCTRD
jgi:hypothetical protein